MQVVIELPDDLAREMHATSGDLARRLLEAFAIEGYRSGDLSVRHVQQLIGLKNRFEVDAFLKKAEVYREYSAEELESDYQASRRASESVQSRS